jgi:hypothetical protein
MLLLLAHADGTGSVTVGAGTAGLGGRVWLYRLSGSGVARGRASSSCTTTPSSSDGASVSTGTMQTFTFRLEPDARVEIWRYGGDEACTLTVTVTGRGPLKVQLRGY